MALPDELAVAVEVGRILDEAGVPYVIGGSVASSMHGLPRSTHDVDVIAALEPSDVAGLLAAVRDRFYAADEAVHRAVGSRRSFNIIHLGTMVKVDVFVAPRDPASRGQLARGLDVELEPGAGQVVRLASAEDTVARKLAWFRKTGETSERQWRDVLGILGVQGPRLQRELVREIAAELAVEDLLERALAEAAGGGDAAGDGLPG